MSTIGETLSKSASLLEIVSESPRLDAEYLLAHSLGCSRSTLIQRLGEDLPPSPGFEAALARRLNREPVAYILGEWEFYSLELAVAPPLLVPRPETEHLVEVALRHLQPGMQILDLCCGTGCVGIAIAHELGNYGTSPFNSLRRGTKGDVAPASLFATDLNPLALEITQANAARHHLPVACRQGDLFDALHPGDGPFDCIVSNPPYVEDAEWEGLAPDITRYEDRTALLAGDDGLNLIRRIVVDAPDRLKPGGLLALEMGEKQWPAVRVLLETRGFIHIAVQKDLAGIDRIAYGIWPG